MAAVEAVLEDEIRSDVRAAYEISGHTLAAGGKRLRPAAVLLSARAVQDLFPERTVYASAASVELIHMASLIHDDVVDQTDQRRGKPTANSVFGNQISVLVGDYLLAKSIYLAAREANMDVIRIFSKVTVGLSEGEVLQITSQGDIETTEETYLKIISRKTAGFVAGCCEVGAVLSGAPPHVIEALSAFGMSLGIAFQIADDLLDFRGDPAKTGKPRGSDLTEGKMTLPLIEACRRLPASDGRRADLARWVGDPTLVQPEDVDIVCELIEENKGFEYAEALAKAYVRKAKDSLLESLSPSRYRDALFMLADHAANRKS